MQRADALLVVAVIAWVTALTRFIPFLIFSRGRTPPPFIRRLSRALPSALIGMLVVYSLRELPSAPGPRALSMLAALLAVVLLHRRFRNTLLSVAAGTFLYMVLIRVLP